MADVWNNTTDIHFPFQVFIKICHAAASILWTLGTLSVCLPQHLIMADIKRQNGYTANCFCYLSYHIGTACKLYFNYQKIPIKFVIQYVCCFDDYLSQISLVKMSVVLGVVKFCNLLKILPMPLRNQLYLYPTTTCKYSTTEGCDTSWTMVPPRGSQSSPLQNTGSSCASQPSKMH